ncbi:MAG: DUF4340 domain-containing protein [Deltaproteobacteria bacterium]|nr:DUF4340 domain-containing protein [Deltaproteobacteria bacterium]
MKRSTWVTLAVFAALLAVYFGRGFKTTEKGPPPLSIDGFVGNVSEQEAREAQKNKLPPVKKIVVKKKDEEIVLEQLPQDPPKDVTPDKDKAPEAKWSAKRTFKGRSTEAKGQVYRANAMADVFARSIRSTFATVAKADALAEYGLDAAKAIDVEITLDSKTVKLRIGNLDKGQEMNDATTWVQDPARPDAVYQVAGRDLRGAFDVAWSEIRDRGLLTLDLAAVDRIDVDNPGDGRFAKFAVARSGLTDAQKKDIAANKPVRDANDGWSVADPKGYEPGDVGDWVKSIERMSANEFLDPAELADKKADTGLDDPKVAAKVTVSMGDKKTVIVFGKTDEASQSKDIWARIEGRDEVYKVASYTRDQVLQRFDQVRDRALLGKKKAAVATAVSLTGPEGTVELTKAAGGWQVGAAGFALSAKAVDSFLSDVDGIKVDYAADVTPGSAGLDAPEWTLKLAFGDGPLTVVLAKEKDGNSPGRVVSAGPQGDLWKLAGWNANKLRKALKDFEDKRLLPFARDTVTSVSVHPKEGAAFELKKTTGVWKVTEAGKTVDAKADAVATWLGTLADLEFSAGVQDKSASEAGLDKEFASIEVIDGSGKTFGLRVSATKAGDDTYVGAVRDGRLVRTATLSSYAVGNTQKKASDFAAGAQ